MTCDAGTLVRPLLEYNCAIWSPHFKKDINLVEGVQRYFTRCIYHRLSLPIVPYDERLATLGLSRLETRRIICDLMETFKLCKDYSSQDIFSYLTFSNYEPTVTRGHQYKLFNNRYVNRVNRQFLFNRVIAIWNGLSCHYFNTNIVSCFRRYLESHNFSAYLLGRT